MAYGNVKKERLEHSDLMSLLKKHFLKDEKDMEEMDEDLGENDKYMGALTHKKRKHVQKPFDASDEYFKGGETGYDPEEVDDKYYDELEADQEPEEDEEEPEEAMPSKDHRKKMAMIVISKKMSKPKR